MEPQYMQIRAYRPSDLEEILTLFRTTVHAVNAADYSPEQLRAWTSGICRERWHATLSAHHSLVALTHGQIAGFADMDATGYIDRLYVHKDYQRQGIATALCDLLERHCDAQPFSTYASLTAEPFFIKRGYRVVFRQTVERGGIFLPNCRMEKP